MKNLMKAATITASAVMLTAGSANAFTLAQSSSASIGATQLNFASSLMLNQYDGSLGALTKLEFIIEGTLDGSTVVSSGSIKLLGGTATATLGADVGIASIGTIITTIPAGALVGAPISFGDPAATFAGSDSDTYSTVILAEFLPYLGAGMVNVPISGDLANSFMTTGSGSLTTLADATLKLTVNYYVDDAPPPVPEVSTAVSAGAFALLGGVVLLRSRKVAAKA